MAKLQEDVYRRCPCGSGQKYKFCCLDKDRDRRREILQNTSSGIGPDGRPIVYIDLLEGEELHHQGLALIQKGRGREAIPVLERAIQAAPLIPNPYNNLALAHFLVGNPEKAVEISEKVARVIDPGNPFALGNLVHFCLIVGRDDDARKAAEQLRGMRLESEDAAVRVCEAFARLGRHEDVLNATLPGRWRGERRARICFLQGAAAANLGRYELAVERLREAVDGLLHRKRARAYLELLGRRKAPGTLDGDWPSFEAVEWAPWDYLDRVKTDERLRRYPGLVKALVALLNDDPGRGELPLRLLQEIGTPEAVATLRKVATGTFGTEELRNVALNTLRDLNQIGEGEAVRVWFSGQWKDVKCTSIEITDEAVSTVPPELNPLMVDLLEAIRSGKPERAEQLGRELVSKAPTSPAALQNLASALQFQDKLDEAEALLRRAMNLDPRYLFAPASLATILMHRSLVREARELLASVVLPRQVHPQAYAVFMYAHMQAAILDKDIEGAESAYTALQELTPDEKPAREARESMALRIGFGMERFLNDRRRRQEEHRKRLLPPDATVRVCIERYSRLQLNGMASVLGLEGLKRPTKESLLERITAALEDVDHVRALGAALPAEAAKAMTELLSRGGRMPFDEFTKRHGSDKGDGESWGWSTPKSAMGRLKALGFLAEGTVGGEASVLVPVEVRSALAPKPA